MATTLIITLLAGAIHLLTWLMNEKAPIEQIKKLSGYAFLAALLAFLLSK